jgi:NDP-sugar pyrophosphorylase family protein
VNAKRTARRRALMPDSIGVVLLRGSAFPRTVTGACTVKGDVTINGNVSVKPGAYLDAAYLGTKLTINGNVNVGKDAILGLGCSFGYHDCGFSPPSWIGAVTVNGYVVASQPLTMFLDFSTIHGNVVSNAAVTCLPALHNPRRACITRSARRNLSSFVTFGRRP